jgi:hypothetical protein
MRTSPRGASGSQKNPPITRQFIVSQRKDLVDATPVGIFTVSVGIGEMTGGFFTYTIHCADATDFQCHTGIVTFAAVNKGGVITAAITEVNANEAIAVSTGTLPDTWTIVAGAGIVTITCNANTSFASTTAFYIFYQIHQNSPTGVITPL